MKKILCLLLIVFSLQVSLVSAQKPKNIIFMIGDGMGLSQVTAAYVEQGEMALSVFKSIGLCTTHSADSLVTDSAAAGTALASGYKTNKGMLGMTPDGKEVESILMMAKKSGKATGIIATSTITHATPAAFYAHISNRGNELEIAEQLLKSEIDIIFGGGWENFIPSDLSGGKRKDNVNLMEAFAEADYRVIRTSEEFSGLEKKRQVIGLFAPGALPRVHKEKREPSLAAMTEKAVELLNREKKGFFLMIEGSQIDWAGHERDKEFLLGETIDFDQAIKAAYEFARKDKRTLVIVTADHETGGAAIVGGSMTDKKTDIRFATDYHTASMVPIWSFGPGEEEFCGTMDNTDIAKKIAGFLK